MTSSSPSFGPRRPDEQDEPVDLSKHAGDESADTADDEPFDPYRFGRPDHPIPPEYAPPGYVPDPAPPPAYPPPPTPGPPFYDPPPQGPDQGYEPYVSPYPWRAPTGPSAPYGSPYGPYGEPAGARAGHGKAVAALVLGIGSIVMFWTSLFDAVLVIAALVFGIIALSEVRRGRSPREPGGSGRGLAIGGLICAVLGAVLAIVWTAVILHAADRCGGIDQQQSSDFQQCVRQNLF